MSYFTLKCTHFNWKKLSASGADAMRKFTQQIYGEADHHLHTEKEMGIHYIPYRYLNRYGSH